MTNNKNTICLNCNNEFDNKFNYCPHCGQKNKKFKLDFKYLISDFLSGSFNIDSKFWISFKLLISKPAYLSKEFLKGRRVSFLSPLRMYLLVSLVYFAVLSLDNEIVKFNDSDNVTVNDSITPVIFDNESVSLNDSSLRSKQITAEYPDSTESIAGIEVEKLKTLNTREGREKFNDYFSNYISVGMFFIMPVAAFVLYLFYGRRKKGYYIENLLFFIHLQTLIFLILTVFNLLELIINSKVLDAISLLSVFIVSVIWLKNFYTFKWLKSVFATFLFLISYLVIVLISFVITAYFSILFM